MGLMFCPLYRHFVRMGGKPARSHFSTMLISISSCTFPSLSHCLKQYSHQKVFLDATPPSIACSVPEIFIIIPFFGQNILMCSSFSSPSLSKDHYYSLLSLFLFFQCQKYFLLFKSSLPLYTSLFEFQFSTYFLGYSSIFFPFPLFLLLPFNRLCPLQL